MRESKSRAMPITKACHCKKYYKYSWLKNLTEEEKAEMNVIYLTGYRSTKKYFPMSIQGYNILLLASF